jgi:hypothetical protein
MSNAQGVEEILAPISHSTGHIISDEFKQNVQPIDQARMEAILFAVAYPHCVVNQEETACNIVRAQQPKQP